MAQVLELAQLAQHDRVTDVQVRARRVHAELHAELTPLLARLAQLLLEAVLGDDLIGAPAQDANGLRHARPHAGGGVAGAASGGVTGAASGVVVGAGGADLSAVFCGH